MNAKLNGLRKRLDRVEPDDPLGCRNCAGPPLVEVAEGEDPPPLSECLNPDRCRPVRRIVVCHLPPRGDLERDIRDLETATNRGV